MREKSLRQKVYGVTEHILKDGIWNSVTGKIEQQVRLNVWSVVWNRIDNIRSFSKNQLEKEIT